MLRLGDLVMPKPEYVGYGDYFIIEEVDYMKHSFKIKLIEKFSQDCNYINNIHEYYYDELDLIRTIESLEHEQEHSRRSINIREIIDETIYKHRKNTFGKTWKNRIFEPTPDNPFEIKTPNIITIDELNKALKGITITATPYEPYEIEKEREENKMEILNLYYKKHLKEIEKTYDEKIKAIEETDEIQEVITEMLKQVDTMYKNFGERTLAERGITIYSDIFLDKTKKAIEELKDEKTQKIVELRDKLEEISALCKLTDSFTEKMDIFVAYGITDKKGRLL